MYPFAYSQKFFQEKLTLSSRYNGAKNIYSHSLLSLRYDYLNLYKLNEKSGYRQLWIGVVSLDWRTFKFEVES